jgi:hypothetical protein
VAADETWLTDYISNNTKALQLNLSTGAGATAAQVQVHMNAHNIQTAKKNKGKSYIEFDVTGIAEGNTTDVGLSGGFSPCLITCQNAVNPQTFG